MCETAKLVFASDKGSEEEISINDVDLLLFDGGNELITSDYSSDEEGKQPDRGSRNFAGGML